jgi:hypothetical protein
MLREKYKRIESQIKNRWNNETTSSNMKNKAEYRVFATCAEDNLTIVNTKLRVRVFGKNFVNNIVEI